MSRWSQYLDDQVARQRARRDPLSRLPWWVLGLVAVVIVAIGVAQTVYGTGLSRVIGVALLVFVAPSQVVSALAAKRAAQPER